MQKTILPNIETIQLMWPKPLIFLFEGYIWGFKALKQYSRHVLMYEFSDFSHTTYKISSKACLQIYKMYLFFSVLAYPLVNYKINLYRYKL